jgi:hypothetical protein
MLSKTMDDLGLEDLGPNPRPPVSATSTRCRKNLIAFGLLVCAIAVSGALVIVLRPRSAVDVGDVGITADNSTDKTMDSKIGGSTSVASAGDEGAPHPDDETETPILAGSLGLPPKDITEECTTAALSMTTTSNKNFQARSSYRRGSATTRSTSISAMTIPTQRALRTRSNPCSDRRYDSPPCHLALPVTQPCHPAL